MRIEQLLSDSASRHGGKAAIVAAGRTHTYADLARGSDRAASALKGRGLKRGDRVAIFMDNTFEAVVSAFAALKAGAVAAPIDAESDVPTLRTILTNTGAAVLVTEARLASVAAAAVSAGSSVQMVVLAGGDPSTSSASCMTFEQMVRGFDKAMAAEAAGAPGDAALILHAISDNGQPTSATFTHAEIAKAAAPAERVAPQPLTPILSGQGLLQLIAAVRAGATLVLETSSALRYPVPALSQLVNGDAFV